MWILRLSPVLLLLLMLGPVHGQQGMLGLISGRDKQQEWNIPNPHLNYEPNRYSNSPRGVIEWCPTSIYGLFWYDPATTGVRSNVASRSACMRVCDDLGALQCSRMSYSDVDKLCLVYSRPEERIVPHSQFQSRIKPCGGESCEYVLVISCGDSVNKMLSTPCSCMYIY